MTTTVEGAAAAAARLVRAGSVRRLGGQTTKSGRGGEYRLVPIVSRRVPVFVCKLFRKPLTRVARASDVPSPPRTVNTIRDELHSTTETYVYILVYRETGGGHTGVHV